MRAELLTSISVNEYLEAEQDAETSHEYDYGEVFAVAGGSVDSRSRRSGKITT